MKQTIWVLLAAGIMAWGCGSAKQTEPKDSKDTVVNQSEHHREESEAIELNNGEKWVVDDNMIEHIRTMEKDIAAFNKTSLKDYHDLSANLQKNIDLLTSNCTMKGKAHDELHKWLLPYIDLVAALAKTTTDKEGAEVMEDLQESFKTFNQYFQ